MGTNNSLSSILVATPNFGLMRVDTKFLVRGLGFFNDAYDLFVMNVVNVVLEEEFGKDVYTPAMKGSVSAAALIGAVFGQIIFGYLADVLGRRVNMIITCAILILGGVICACASGGSPTGTLWVLVVARGILGVGIGGEYPLAAAASAEDASSVEERNRRVALTFSLQGLGSLTAAIMGNLYVAGYAPGPRGSASKDDLDFIWRSLFGIGIIPAAFVFFFRYRAEETATFQQAQQQQQQHHGLAKTNSTTTPTKATSQISNNIPVRFVLQVYGRWILGTAGTWFLFDIVFYAQNLFSASILSVVGISEPTLTNVTTQNVVVACVALPGYYVAVYFINRLGRRKMQLQGFTCMMLLFMILSSVWSDLQHDTTGFVLLYGLALFFSNFGPNTSTFVLPTEMFPTAIRARCHGFSAAMGKLGAAIGSYGFARSSGQDNLGATFGAFAVFCFISIPLTWYCTFDNPSPLSDGDAEFDRRLRIFRGTALQDEDFNDIDDDDLADEEVDVDIAARMKEDRAKMVLMRRWFEFLDTDGSGEIGLNELEDPLVSVGLAKCRLDVRQLIQTVDDSDNGEVNFDEFLSMMRGQTNVAMKQPRPPLSAPKSVVGTTKHFFSVDLQEGKLGDLTLPFPILITAYRRRMLLNAHMAPLECDRSQGRSVLTALEVTRREAAIQDEEDEIQRAKQRQRRTSMSYRAGNALRREDVEKLSTIGSKTASDALRDGENVPVVGQVGNPRQRLRLPDLYD
ncbi:hypothetical protein DYB31_007112 [Aphanomyces astaci]|uniref:Uncharacterized protein n=1 Tax=Aphanomyces astaci TaxID=112090 RepID=A0A397ETJ3_APHAT|nr:hypothetical protein DYB31_007112 [Aphanomyces astaci]